MSTLIAFKNTTITKPAILKQLRAHAKADEIVQGTYWQDGKGCAVGCTIHSRNHAEYETRFGIPRMLARLEDCIFEGLPNGKAKAWPIQFMTAVKPGSDLSRVGWHFLYWLLTDEKVNPGINHPHVKDAVKACADILLPLTKGQPVDRSAAERAARAAESVARAAWSAESAAESAESAERAARAAWSAESAAWSAVWSAGSAASAAESAAASAANAAGSAVYVRMSQKLIALIKAASR